jgi:hypothetical protein
VKSKTENSHPISRWKAATKLIGLVLLSAYLAYWYSYGNGVVLIKSKCPNRGSQSIIIVRKLPLTPPLLAHFLSRFTDMPAHRCEFRYDDRKALFSAHTYYYDSLNARSAEVEWDASGGAIVYIPVSPVLKVDRDGFWSKAK